MSNIPFDDTNNTSSNTEKHHRTNGDCSNLYHGGTLCSVNTCHTYPHDAPSKEYIYTAEKM